jgi:hypothetical protein
MRKDDKMTSDKSVPNPDIIWEIGIAMHHWQNTQLSEKGSIDKEISHVGVLFRRYLEERYGANQVYNVLEKVLNPSKGQQKDKNITLFTPFGLILREEMTLNPTIID